MDKKLYHLGNGKVVKPEFDPSTTDYFSDHIHLRPIYAYCDPSNPVGWIEGEEVYQILIIHSPLPYIDEWVFCPKENYETYSYDRRRIWIEPRKQPDFHREAEELYPNTRSNGNDIYHNNDLADAQQEAHIKARQMSEQEIRELRGENERLKTWCEVLYRDSAKSKVGLKGILELDYLDRLEIDLAWQQFKSENNL